MNNIEEGLRTPSKKPRTCSSSSPSNQPTNTTRNSAKKGTKNAKITNFFCKVNSPLNRNNSNSNNDMISENDNQPLSDDLSKDASSNSMKVSDCNAGEVAKRQLTKGQTNLNKQDYVFIVPSSDDDTNVSAKGSTRRKAPSVHSNDSKSSDGFILTSANNELAIVPKRKSTINTNTTNKNTNMTQIAEKQESLSNNETPVTRCSTRGSSKSRDSLPGKKMKMDSPSIHNRNSNDQKITRIQPTHLGRLRTKMIDFQSVPSDLNMPRDQAVKLIEKLFSLKMPEDFFLFWEFAKTINHRKPCSAFSHAHLEWNLVGPYDVLSGLITDFHGFSKDNLHRHCRFYYDPPEFQTVVTKKDSHMTHYGYYRDDPNQDKPIVVMNQAAHNGIIQEVGDNLFTLLRSELDSSIASLSKSSQEIPTLMFSSSSSSKTIRGKLNQDDSSMKQTQLEKAKAKQELTIIRDKLIDFCSSHENLSCESWSRTNLRKSKICGKTLNTIGVIMPHQDETEGSGCSRHDKVSDDERSCSRGIEPTDLKLKTMLTKISDSSDDRTKLRLYKELHQIINNANDANEKCDTNVSLILGLDLFYQGDPIYHNDVLSLLTGAYTELNRTHFIDILKDHLNDRNKGDKQTGSFFEFLESMQKCSLEFAHNIFVIKSVLKSYLPKMNLLHNLTFDQLQIVGQSAEREVIFCYHLTKRRLIGFDQHAADERIRYELLLDKLDSQPQDLDTIKSRACHGAIRFGDKLSLYDCQKLIKRLLKCKVPFKCAHSRCGVSVLKNIDTIIYKERIKENFNKLI